MVIDRRYRRQVEALQLRDFGGLEAFFGFGDFVFDAIAFLQRLEPFPSDAGEVDEDVLASSFLRDKTETLLIIEPLDNTVSHVSSPPA
jgi:hypothetical protein